MDLESSKLRRGLREAGLSDQVIDAAWPSWWSDDLAADPSGQAELRFALARKLGLSPRGLIGERVEFIWNDEARFKHLSTEDAAQRAALASFGVTIGRSLIRGTPSTTTLDGFDAHAIRDAVLASQSYVDLHGLLALCWGVGIPVIYLRVFPLDAKSMHAMVVRVDDRYAILLGRDTSYPAPVAFTLAHELGHLVLGHLEDAPAQDVATLRFDLKTGDIVNLSGRPCIFERRLDGQLQFLQLEDKDVIFLTDEQLAHLSGNGQATFVAASVTYSKKRGPLPSRLKMTDLQIQQANRKLDYVGACLRGCADEDDEPPTNWDMPRSKALNEILQQVAERRGETAPFFTTVLKWIDRWVALSSFHGKASLIDRTDLKGNRSSRIGHVAELAIEFGIRRWLTPGMSVPLAYAKVDRYMKIYRRKLARYMTPDEIALIETPSDRTFHRRCADVPPYVRDYFKKGAGYANKFHRIFNRQPLPERPYEDVEVDHCTLDIVLVDDESDLVLRPGLITSS